MPDRLGAGGGGAPPAGIDLTTAVWHSSRALVAVADAMGIVREASPVFTRLAGRDPRGSRLAGFLAEDQANGFASWLIACGPEWSRRTWSLFPGSTGTGRDYAVAVRVGPGGRVVLLAEPASTDDVAAELIDLTAALIDERRTIEAERARRERQARDDARWAVFEEAPFGVALIDSNTGRILEANPRLAEITGRSRAELAELDWMAITHADDAARQLQEMARFLAGEAVNFATEKRYLRPDGSAIWVSATLARVPTDDPAQPRHLGMAQDITERKRAEVELRQQHQFVQTILEHAPIGFALNEVDSGARVFISRRFAEIYGVTPERIRSQADFFELAYRDPDFREEMRARIMADLASGDPDRMWWHDIPITTESGEQRYISAGNIPLPDQNLMISTVQDVTWRKRAENERESLQAQLNQAQKMESVGRLAGGVAHDFNNLLTAITGFGGLLAESLPADGPEAADLAEMLRAAERATELTRQLLAFSRQAPLEPRVLDLPTVLRGIGPMLRRVIGEDVELVMRSAAGPGRALADPGQLEQVVVNLAVNARDAMPDGGVLTLETALADIDDEYAATHPEAQVGRYVLLAVSDTGHGMGPEVLEHIFEPFFTTKGHGKGTGLGLSTVFGIVRQSGGYISAYSELGRGTTFKVFLPRVDEPATAAPPPAVSAAARGGSETILIVEDEDTVRLFASRVLERSGYRVLAVSNGDEAIALAKADPSCLDLLFTDIVMPGLSGPQVAVEILRICPRAGLLYTSGYTGEAALQVNMIEPDALLLSKPYGAEALLEHVRTALESAAARPAPPVPPMRAVSRRPANLAGTE